MPSLRVTRRILEKIYGRIVDMSFSEKVKKELRKERRRNGYDEDYPVVAYP
jgi:predicted translin family RNA/ssDNA-binding protein